MTLVQAAVADAAPKEKSRRRRARPKEDIMGRLTSSPWREEALARAAQLKTLLEWLREESTTRHKDTLCKAVEQHLDAVCQSAHGTKLSWASLNGAAVERTTANLSAAEAHLYRLATPDFLSSNLPNLLCFARSNLPKDDPRRQRLEKIENHAETDTISERDRNIVIAAYEGAAAAGRKEQLRVRGFRNVILVASALAAALAVGIALLFALYPQLLPLCFAPDDQVVCPTSEQAIVGSTPATTQESAEVTANIRNSASPFDTALVEFVGLLGATVAAATAIRNMRASADPYSLPVAVAVLKLPMGALTAFLGLLLIRAGFVPGLSALDSSEQIIAWALVLGFAQQLFTYLVDRQANDVLSQFARTSTPTDRPADQS
jgi:hypothetical protein